MVPEVVAAILSWVASAFDAISFDPLGTHMYCSIGIACAIILLAVAVLWRPNSTWPFLRSVVSGLWRLLRGAVRLYRYGCTTIVSLIPNTISLLCQSLSAGSLFTLAVVAVALAVAMLIGHLRSQLAFPAPTRSIAAARTTRPSARMIRNPRRASGSTLQPVLRFLRNMPSRYRIGGAVVIAGAAGVAVGSAGVVPGEVSPLDFFVAQVHRIPTNVFVATGAILLGAIPYENVWNYVSDTANRYETMVRRARRGISPGSSP